MARRARARVAQELDWRPQSHAYVRVFDELFGMCPRDFDTEVLGMPVVALARTGVAALTSI